jgi:hypothetical protein
MGARPPVMYTSRKLAGLSLDTEEAEVVRKRQVCNRTKSAKRLAENRPSFIFPMSQ